MRFTPDTINDQAVLEAAKTAIVGRGFLGMMVLFCKGCRDYVHFKPIIGTTHFCNR